MADLQFVRRLYPVFGGLLPLLLAGAALGSSYRGSEPRASVQVALPVKGGFPRGVRARVRIGSTTFWAHPSNPSRGKTRLRIPVRYIRAAAAETGSSVLRVRVRLMARHRDMLDTIVTVRADSSVRGGANAPGDSERLRWAPPRLNDPRTVMVASGQDPYILNLPTTNDYVVELPRGGVHGTVEINGGHNVVLIGGEVTVPRSANQHDNGADNTDTAIYVRGSTGTVHIEGVVIRAQPATQFDGIDVNAPLASVQVENVRMEDVYGSRSSEHADVIQTWGGAKALRVDRLSANGDYQGLTIAPALGRVASTELEKVDLKAEAPPPALAEATRGGGIMLWLTSGTGSCEASPVTLQEVYIANETSRLASADTVWPSPASRLPCGPVLAHNAVSWPALPVNGSVALEAPPGGPFVPQGVAGSSYVSPGYASG